MALGAEETPGATSTTKEQDMDPLTSWAVLVLVGGPWAVGMVRLIRWAAEHIVAPRMEPLPEHELERLERGRR